ncbi:MAG: bifunctional glutamate N-acetyltransferase/amino-acid acetyltransferase ArgJ [Chloroflexota bacterium]
MNAKIDFVNAGTVTSPRGFQAGATYASIKGGIEKKGDRPLDMGIIFSEVSCVACGLFTTNRIKAAPVVLSQEHLQGGRARAIVVNSGCANACTGEPGLNDAREMARLTAQKFGGPAEEVMVASTGVIGVALPMDKIKSGIENIALSPDGGHDVANAIMTTDTVPKEAAVKVQIGGSEFTIGGITKGSGMIHPNMGTMLCFLATDAAVELDFMKKALKNAVDISFNMITVDGDTSTNDTAILMANGKAGNKPISMTDEQGKVFQLALDKVCVTLAKKMAADGEGASKMIEVSVQGAPSIRDARQIARTVVGSSLVKTAVYGNDPNWGRIIAAAGRSGVDIVETRTDLEIGGVPVLKGGQPLSFDPKVLIEIFKRKEVPISLNFNLGTGSATAWGCDMTEEYVHINADYTT